MAFYPLTGYHLFSKCDEAKHNILKNELIEDVSGITKTNASKTTQDPTPHYLRNCCHDDLRVSRIRKIDIDHMLGHVYNNKKEESLTRFDNCLKTLPFGEGDCECACALKNYEGHGHYPNFITVKAFGTEFQCNLSKAMKVLFNTCYKDLGN